MASEDVVKHYPYAPFIMHIIAHMSDIHFPSDAPHKVLKLSNKTSLQAKQELEEAAKEKEKAKAKVPQAPPHVLLHHVLHALIVLIVRRLSPPPPPVVSPPASLGSS